MSDKEIDVFKIDETNEAHQLTAKQRRDREIDDIKSILRLPGGRRFILRVFVETGTMNASFTLNSMTTAFNEGKRDIGIWLLKEIDQAEPMAYSQMLREYFSELKSKKPKENKDE